MIRLLELDLAESGRELPKVGGEAWVLVRHGRQLLGELRVPDIAHVRDTLRRDAIQGFAPALVLTPEAETVPPLVEAGRVSIVVCTRDRAGLLRGCLQRLVSLRPAPGQILVVDNAPRDESTKAVAAEFEVEYTVEPEPGLDNARNTGWRTARGDVVCYIDDDARVDGGYVAAVQDGFLDESIGAVTGLVLPHELISYPQVAFERLENGMRKGFQRQIFGPGSVGLQAYRLGVGTNMAFRRRVLADLGGFDPDLDVGTASRGGGDLDMLWRVLDGGHQLVYEPNALVRHIHRRTRRGLIAQFADNGTAYRAFLERLAQRQPGLRPAIRREIRQWHIHRHLIEPLRLARWRKRLHVQMLLAEANGSRRGVAAVKADRS